MAENDQDKQDQPQDPKKIIIDDDWKSQAQAEKEELAREVEQQQAQAGAGRGGQRELPEASFSTLVSTLATQALLALGGMEDPKTNRRYVDLDLAKHHIDTLSVLEEKTKGNLSDEEAKLLDQALYETRLTYVELAQRISQASGGEQAGDGQAPGGQGPGGQMPGGPSIQQP